MDNRFLVPTVKLRILERNRELRVHTLVSNRVLINTLDNSSHIVGELKEVIKKYM